MVTLKTPGVYVEEITKFPPSVAPVATAIPAFIGYTEKATKALNGDLATIPTRITSMLDYETYFGQAFKETAITVQVTSDDKIVVDNPSPSNYKMYYAMQMYFANGGGPCYVVSVGTYGKTSPDAVSLDDLEDGLAAIRKEDEPTLLLFPDSQSLSETNFYAINQSALTQCNQLQDRFTIMDTFGDDEDAIGNFRSGISLGKDYLKYGAAYYPFLDTILDYAYNDKSVVVIEKSTELPEDRIAAIRDGIDSASLTRALKKLGTLNTEFGTMLAADVLKCIPDVNTQVSKIVSYLNQLKLDLQLIATIGDEIAELEATAVSDWIEANIDILLASLEGISGSVASQTTKSGLVTDIGDVFTALGVSGPAFIDGFVASVATVKSTEITALYAAIEVIDPSPSTVEYALNELESLNNTLYNRIKGAISDYPVTLAPSSAMAGIYARVDNTLGVWKAPANVGVSYVQKPTVQISNEEQSEMNVTSSGKSVNAIRTFKGKGTLVWGARTLAGNDNEWRYISVRRFFSFVEESVSEASEQFVFEPNTANTWVRLRSMIENFLIQQWKAGALAGAKPEEAFYVRVGLGQTMTAEDILEGRMIVEIGMAAVRPAEFIVLRFSHKMQES